MTIHRVATAEGAEQVRMPLKRLLVTIDDLDALVSLLQSQDGALTYLPISFDGGYMTDARDIVSLTDLELRSLSITAPHVQVLLSRTEAVAIGDRNSVDAVYQGWARSRQTNRYPSRRYALNRRYQAIAFTGLAIVSTGLLADTLVTFFIPPVPAKRLTPTDLALFSFFSIFGIGYGFKYWLRDRRLPSFAVIEPMRLAEYRERRPTTTFNRYTLAFSFVGLIVGMLTVVVAVMALK